MTKELKLAALATCLLTAFACGRAQWQEARGPANVAQPNGQGTETETPAQPAPKPTHRVASFDNCGSQTLSVEVTYAKGDVTAVQDFWTTTARYPRVKVTQVQKKATKTTFYLNAGDENLHACLEKTCAEAAGWSSIQNDLQDLNGVSVKCFGAPPKLDDPPRPVPTPQDSGSGEGRG